jgi:hypothetical protein
MADARIEDAVKKERHRSPNYPAVGLREAVDRAKKFYTADGKAGAPSKLAAVHIGFSKPHGQAMSVLAALKRFGLIIDAGGRVVPTQRAIEILNLPESDPRRRIAISEAALSPPIYKELVEKHRKTGLPNRDVLEAELVAYKSFNPAAVKGFVSDLLDTLEYAGITVEDGVDSDREESPTEVKVGDFVQWVSQGSERFHELKRVTELSDDGEFAFLAGENTGFPVDELEVGQPPLKPPPPVVKPPARPRQNEGGNDMRQDVFSLDDGGEVTISWPVPLTQDMVTDIKDWLKIVERKITRSIADAKETATEVVS